MNLAQCLYLAERWPETRTAYEVLATKYPDEIAYKRALGCLAARRGDRNEAVRISDEIRRLDRPYQYGKTACARACIAAQLGQKDEAVLLREAVAQGFNNWGVASSGSYAFTFGRDMDLEPLRGYPPFEELIRPKE